MKFGLVTMEYPPFKGGVANYYEGLVSHWPEGDGISVLHNAGGSLVSPQSRPAWLPAFRTIRDFLRKERIDYLLVGQLLPLGTVAYLLSFVLKFRYAVFLHGMDFEFSLKRRRKRWLSRLILSRADKIICTNSYVAGRVRDVFGLSKKIVVINPGIAERNLPDTAKIAKIRDSQGIGEKKILLSIGRMVRRKGFDFAIEAFGKLNRKDAVYFLSGCGPDEEQIRSEARGIDNIRFLGNLSEEDKWAWLGSCDAFIMPSRDIDGDVEGFGIVYLEANMMSKPVIAGRSGGVGDAVIDGVNGLMVDPEDTDDIGRAIVRLLDDDSLRSKLGEEGRRRAIKEFSWKALTERLHSLLIL